LGYFQFYSSTGLSRRDTSFENGIFCIAFGRGNFGINGKKKIILIKSFVYLGVRLNENRGGLLFV
jgi:hypothetical protein